MFQRVLALGLLGVAIAIVGCAARPNGGSDDSDTPAATATPQPTDQTGTAKAPQIKQVTLSVDGMT